jgi:hypothetical protein
MARENRVRTSIIATVAVTASLAGCVTSHPQTAEEFRQAVPGAAFAKTETFEVNRDYREVAKTFQKKAPECLNVTVRTTSQTTTSYQVIVTAYKPTVRVSAQRAELHVQQHHKQGVMKVTKEPEGGYYLLVADAYPAGKNKTRVQMFGPSVGHAPLIQAIKGWASGQNLGCPDMTKI